MNFKKSIASILVVSTFSLLSLTACSEKTEVRETHDTTPVVVPDTSTDKDVNVNVHTDNPAPAVQNDSTTTTTQQTDTGAVTTETHTQTVH